MIRSAFCLLTAAAVLLGLGVPLAGAQQPTGNWNQDYDPHVAAIGLGLGFTSGTGLGLRWPALPQTMMGVMGGVWGSSNDLAWNIGTDLHYILRQAGRIRFYTGPALALYSDDEDDNADVNVSIGVGLEILLRPRMSAKLDIGFTYFGDDDNIYPMPQASVFFYF